MASKNASFFCAGAMVANWKATLVDSGRESGQYKVQFEWDHDHNEYITFPLDRLKRVENPIEDPRCQGDSSEKARDGLEWWMPRLHWKEVSPEITAVTGIEVVDVSWQPCGHKEIAICHAESHYDIHLYYVKKDRLQQMPNCEIGSAENPRLPVCRDSATEANHDYFRMLKNDLPSGSFTVNGQVVPIEFCVDPTSAILQSGVHYGDVSETKNEWRRPVTIIGSHDCQLMFFEPMVSWNWIANRFANGTAFGWPVVEIANIKYNKKTFEALPNRWSVEVKGGCRLPVPRNCHITLVVEGSPCPATGCKLKRECGTDVIDCTTGAVYQSPYQEATFMKTTTSTASTSITTRTVTSSTTSMSTSVSSATTASISVGATISTTKDTVTFTDANESVLLSTTKKMITLNSLNETNSSRDAAPSMEGNSSSVQNDENSIQELTQSAPAVTSCGSTPFRLKVGLIGTLFAASLLQ